MQKNDKSFTFLFKHKNKSRIYFRRISISKNYLAYSGLGAGTFLFISIVSIGVMAMTDRGLLNGPIASSLFSAGTQTQASLGTQNQTAQIDYSRPNAFDDLSINSGGPFDPDEAGSDDAELERQLKVIELTSDPATLPSIWAHMGKINNEFGFRRNPFGGRTYEFHAGMDIDGERGDMVVAPANGTVTEAGWKGGYGQFIEIDHGNGLKTRYGHLSKIEIAAGDVLARGQLIGNVGSTGRSTGPHLHYELRLNERPINPRRFLPQEPTELKKL
ncbi:MAG: M23 family metallopeptidase [Chloracidobacterium sp.]|nr:M23 family metallopeptidase [Chloracidobacterium sp.]